MGDSVAIFIDGGYLEKVLKEDFGQPKVDFKKLSLEIVRQVGGGRTLYRTYYYNCPPFQSSVPTDEERRRLASQESFIHALKQPSRLEIRMGRLVRRGQPGAYTYEQKQVDMLLGIDVVRLVASRAISDVAIIAGDSDFVPALQVAKNDGAIVHLFHGKNPHLELRDLSDEHHLIDQDFIKAISMY